jgi:hypothetical protein
MTSSSKHKISVVFAEQPAAQLVVAHAFNPAFERRS